MLSVISRAVYIYVDVSPNISVNISELKKTESIKLQSAIINKILKIILWIATFIELKLNGRNH